MGGTRTWFAALLRYLRLVGGTSLIAWASLAAAASYRCDDAGRVTYTNLPCPSGQQRELLSAPAPPDAADQAAAIKRQAEDRAKLTKLERTREEARKEDERAAARAMRRHSEHTKRGNDCAALALRAKRAAEDFETAGPRDQPGKRIKARRAAEDYAASCGRR